MESSERGPLCSVLALFQDSEEATTKMSKWNSRSKKPDVTSVTRKWNTSLYTRTMGEIHKQSNDYLNGYTKLATKLKRTHSIV